MNLLSILRKCLFFPLIVLAIINQVFGIPVILILFGLLIHKLFLFICITVLVLIVDIFRHKWLIKHGYGVPVVGQYVNKKRFKDLKERIDEYEEKIS